MSSLTERLTRTSVTVAEARRAPDKKGAPEEPGVYAFWLIDPKALDYLPAAPHPVEPDWRLLYVGIAPRREGSKTTLRARLLKQHLRGAVGSSTFRRSLAALLWDEQGWTPRLADDGREALDETDLAKLDAWQARALRVSWAVLAEPWKIEGYLVDTMAPALNLDGNDEHPFHEEMSNAREAFRVQARAK